MSYIEKAAELIHNSKHLTAFTGAGISVESGIPPFRGSTGLWSKYDPIVLDINYLHSHTLEAWTVIRELFYDFFGKAKPNAAHLVLARLEEQKKLQSIVTQNIDNLHQEAGSREVYEFHGTAQRMICVKCGSTHHAAQVDLTKLPPICSTCNQGFLKPDFIFFGEGIPERAYKKSIEAAQKADVFLIIGTTGEIMPASTIPHIAKQNGAKIIEVNPENSTYTRSITDVYLQGKAGTILPEMETALQALSN